MADSDREITIVIKGKNVVSAEFKEAAGDTKKLGDAVGGTKKQAEGFTGTLKSFVEEGLSPIPGAAGLVMSGMGALAGVFAVRTIAGWITDTIDFAGHLDDLSKGLGESASDIQAIGFAGKRVGLDLDGTLNIVEQLAKRVATGDDSARAALQGLGLDFNHLRTLKPIELFSEVADAVNKIDDPLAQAGIGSELFGKQFQGALRMAKDGLRETMDEAKRTGAVLDDEAIKTLDNFGDKVGDITTKLKVMSAQALAPMIDQLAKMLMITQQTSHIGEFIDPEDQKQVEQYGLALGTTGVALEGLGLQIKIDEASVKALTVAHNDHITSADRVRNRLKALKDEAMAPLSAEQRKHIGELSDWGVSEKEIAELVGTNTIAVKKAVEAHKEAEASTKKITGAQRELRESIARLNNELQPTPGHFVLISEQAKVFGDEAAKAIQKAALLGVEVPESVRAVAAAWNESEINKLMVSTTQKWLKDLDEFNKKAATDFEAASNLHFERFLKNDASIRDVTRETSRLTRQLTLSDYEFQRSEIQQWAEDEKRKLFEREGNWGEANDVINRDAEVKFALLKRQHDQMIAEMVAAPGFWEDAWEAALSDVPNMFAQAFTGGGGLEGAAKGMIAKFGGMAGQQLLDARNFGIPVAQALDKVLPQQVVDVIGRALPGVGALVGPAFGALFGKLFNHEYGEVKKARAEFEASMGGTSALIEKVTAAGSTAEAALHRLWDAKNVKDYNEALKALQGELDAFDRKQDEIFTHGVSDVISGFNKIAIGFSKPLSDGVQNYVQVHAQLLEAQEKSQSIQDEITQAWREGFDENSGKVARLRAELASTTVEIGQLTRQLAQYDSVFTEGMENGQEQFERLGRLSVVTMGVGLASGKSLRETIDSISTGLDAMDSAQEQFNLSADKGVQTLFQYRQFIRQHADLADSVDGVNQMLRGLDSTLFITQDSFSDLSAIATEDLAQIKQGGLDGNIAMSYMQPTLQTLWQLWKDNGYAVDEHTQQMLEDAEAADIVGDKHRTVNEQMLKGVNRIADATEALVTAMGITLPSSMKSGVDKALSDAGRLRSGISDAVAAIPRTIDIELNGRWNVDDMPAHASGGVFSTPHIAAIAEGGHSEIVGDVDFMTRALTGALSRVGSSNAVPAMAVGDGDIYIVVADGKAERVSEAQFRQIQGALSNGLLRVPARAIVTRGG